MGKGIDVGLLLNKAIFVAGEITKFIKDDVVEPEESICKRIFNSLNDKTSFGLGENCSDIETKLLNYVGVDNDIAKSLLEKIEGIDDIKEGNSTVVKIDGQFFDKERDCRAYKSMFFEIHEIYDEQSETGFSFYHTLYDATNYAKEGLVELDGGSYWDYDRAEQLVDLWQEYSDGVGFEVMDKMDIRVEEFDKEAFEFVEENAINDNIRFEILQEEELRFLKMDFAQVAEDILECRSEEISDEFIESCADRWQRKSEMDVYGMQDLIQWKREEFKENGWNVLKENDVKDALEQSVDGVERSEKHSPAKSQER